jgi:hypothetical protein
VSVLAESITIGGDVEAWRSIGLTVSPEGAIPLFGTSLRIVSPDRGRGVIGWSLSGPRPNIPSSVPESGTHDGKNDSPDDATLIDGLHTEWVEAAGPTYAAHALGASSLDHIVVLTPDLERTSGSIAEATGHELRRVREVGSMRQGFHRIGERGEGGLIVELVERPDIEPGPAAFWGIVLIVDDLDVACDLIGPDRISAPKDAVQPGRRIATLRSDAGLDIPVALMT